MLKLAINGANGKMGQKLLNLILKNPELYELVLARTFHLENNVIASDSYYLTLPHSTTAEVMVDFSNQERIEETLNWCLTHKIPLVIGTTGFTGEQMKKIKDAAAQIAIVHSANMSLSVNVLFEAVKMVAKKLADYEVEIVESHHRYKKDAPSGTALEIGKLIAEARGDDFDKVACYNRTGNNNEVRDSREIGFSALRAGDIVGRHVVDFISDGEELSIISNINNRRGFALGALAAAKFVVKQTPGLYSMQDVLEI